MKGPNSFDWTDEAVATVRRLHDEGLSYSRIAAELGHGLTRSAVLGKVHRLKLKPHGRQKKMPAWQRKPRKPWVPRQLGSTMKRAPTQMSALAAVRKIVNGKVTEGPDFPPETSANPGTLMQLEPHSCRWPLGDARDPDMLYCGAERIEGYSYCMRHCAIAYQPGRAREVIQTEITSLRRPTMRNRA